MTVVLALTNGAHHLVWSDERVVAAGPFLVTAIHALKLPSGRRRLDLAMALAIASSYRDAAVMPQTAAIGEVGLSGEIRAVNQLDRRLTEVSRLGFKRCLVPKTSAPIKAPKDIQLLTAATLREAIRVGLVGGHEKP